MRLLATAPPAGLSHWYANELGWPVVGAEPLSLLTGVCFDALDVPAEAGFAVLRRFKRLPRALGPVALDERRVRLLVAAGSAEELPGVLDWLEWTGIPLDLALLGTGGRMPAPAAPRNIPQETAHGRPAPVWLRPPEPGCELESSLPAMTLTGRSGISWPGGTAGANEPVGLVALVSALATACHRVRLRANQACAFS